MTTIKQAEWEKHKAEQRFERTQTRGVAVTIAEVRKKTPHIDTCNHTAKHHRKGGGCRKGCHCNAGMR